MCKSLISCGSEKNEEDLFVGFTLSSFSAGMMFLPYRFVGIKEKTEENRDKCYTK